jgi:gliding motility-associated-like protein
LTPTVTTPTAVACEGTMAWIFNYTDCAGNTAAWTYTYTIDQPAFTLPFSNTGSTVNCVANAQVQPTPPSAVTDICGNTLTPVVTAPSTTGCSGGTMDWIYTYTDCAGNAIDWVYSYTVSMTAFTLPFSNSGSTVSCIGDAVQPVPPSSVMDECGNVIVPVIIAPIPVSCEGVMDWVYTYTDCAGNSLDWTYTYTIDLPVLSLPTDDIQNIECVSDIVVPTAPIATDACGNVIDPVMTENVDPICSGDKIYTFTYTDCAGNASVYNFTYVVEDITAPTASAPDTIFVEVGESIPAFDVSVVTNEVDNCSVSPVVAFVGEVTDGQKCPETITRTYSITDDCGNVSTVSQLIIVRSGCEIVIPSAFTPNGDQSNDVWEIVDIDNVYPDNVVFVYNRWGNLLYESEQGDYSSRPWDGKVNGEQLPVASYYYIIYTEGDKSGEILNGTVSIIKN